MLALNVNLPGHLPKLPSVPLAGRGSLHTEVTYQAPLTEMVTLGYLPGDSASAEITNAPYTRYNGEVYGGRSSSQLFTNKPKLDENGQPVMVTKTKQIDINPVLDGGATTASVLGGIVGGVVGAVVGLFVGAPGLGALWGAGAGAAICGGSTLVEEGCEKSRVEWRERPIKDDKMVGFSPLENPKITGLDRQRYKADVQSTDLGTYWEPVVVRYNSLTGTITSES